MKRLTTILLQVILFVCITTPCAVAGQVVDKSGVKPNVLSLPSGPGSIQGLGESFEPQLNSGTGSYQIPLTLAKGRAGFTPELALIYNGGNGNSSLGMGWQLSIGSIQRRTDKGLPVYDDLKDVFVGPNGEELIYDGEKYYRCENETSFDRFERDGNAWKVMHKDGSVSWYGLENSSRIEDTKNDKLNIFKWFISKNQDLNGNIVLYKYNETEAFSDIVSDGQVYLTSILYNFNSEADTSKAMKVALKYESRAVHDAIFDYRSRFPVQTSRRCKEIIIYAQDERVRSYTLSYSPDSILSRLISVTMYGKDETQAFPAVLKFDYTQFSLNSAVTAMNKGINPGVGLVSADVDIVDMNGDSLPDLLYTGDVHSVYLNKDGETWEAPYNVPYGFTEVKLSATNTMLMDMNGDGSSDLFTQDLSINGYRYFPGGEDSALSLNITPALPVYIFINALFLHARI